MITISMDTIIMILSILAFAWMFWVGGWMSWMFSILSSIFAEAAKMLEIE